MVSRSVALVAIGVNHTKVLPQLKGAADGARQVARWFESQRQFGVDVTIRLLVDEDEDGSVHPVTLRDVQDAVGEIVTAGKYDLLTLYFGGHGIVKSGSDEQLLLSDVHRYSQEAISVATTVRAARYCGLPHVVIISDACRNAVDPYSFVGQIAGAPVIARDGVIGRKPTQVDVFYATEPSQTAKEYLGEGFFTKILLEALMQGTERVCESWEDQYPYKIIPGWRLEDYLFDEVPFRAAIAEPAFSQTPDIMITSRKPYFLGFAIDTPAVAHPDGPGGAAAGPIGMSAGAVIGGRAGGEAGRGAGEEVETQPEDRIHAYHGSPPTDMIAPRPSGMAMEDESEDLPMYLPPIGRVETPWQFDEDDVAMRNDAGGLVTGPDSHYRPSRLHRVLRILRAANPFRLLRTREAEREDVSYAEKPNRRRAAPRPSLPSDFPRGDDEDRTLTIDSLEEPVPAGASATAPAPDEAPQPRTDLGELNYSRERYALNAVIDAIAAPPGDYPDPSRSTSLRDAGLAQRADAYLLQMPSHAPDDQGRGGILVHGSLILHAALLDGTLLEARELGDYVTFVQFPSVDDSSHTVVVNFVEGTSALMPLMPGNVVLARVDDGVILDIAIQSRDSMDKPGGAFGDESILRRRAVLASLAAAGRIHRVGKFDLERLAAAITHEWAIDPTLALYASYGCALAGNEDGAAMIHDCFRDGLTTLRNPAPVPFDIALLAEAHRQETAPLAPICPMFSLGWSLLDASAASVHPLLRLAGEKRLNSEWTTFRSVELRPLLNIFKKEVQV